jgi:hypothetical protein
MQSQAEPKQYGSADDQRDADEGDYGRLHLAKHFASSSSAGLI